MTIAEKTAEPRPYDLTLDDMTSQSEYLLVCAVTRLAREIKAKAGVPFDRRVRVWAEVMKVLESPE